MGVLYSAKAYYAVEKGLYCRDNLYNKEVCGMVTALCDGGFSVSVFSAERPGAVYLAAAMAAHAQRGLPAFAIYGHDVRDVGMSGITPDVEEKIGFAQSKSISGKSLAVK